jgi:hypothetical protein
MTRLPAWRAQLVRKLKTGDHFSFGGNNPDRDKEQAIAWLQTGIVADDAPDFKVVVRPNRQSARFTYSLCRGSCGSSAVDFNVVATTEEKRRDY